MGLLVIRVALIFLLEICVIRIITYESVVQIITRGILRFSLVVKNNFYI